MKINFTGKYKSLTSFISEELATFSVITGKNGTGKSQLVHCINNALTAAQDPNITYKLSFDQRITRVEVSDLLYKSNGQANTAMLRTKLDSYFNVFSNTKQKSKQLYSFLIDKQIALKDFLSFNKLEITSFLSIPNFKAFAVEILSEKGFGGHGAMHEDVIYNNFKQSLLKDNDLYDILYRVKYYTDKDIFDFTKDDFYKTPLPEKYIDSADMFNSKVETVFINYLRRRHDNDYLTYRNQKFGHKNKVIDDSEFDRLYPAPWETINKILTENQIPLKVKTYSIEDYSEQINVELKFKKDSIKDYITFGDLSSGEKIIVGLILILFTEKYYENDLKFPELIVLDEPDAHLHPEMSKLLIDVLYKSFVLGLGVKVIMTTHSPSTVALTPEDSIFEMSNTPTSLKKISKDAALELLTGIIPTLSIDYKNHKQIFLESPTDVIYFQKLFNKINSEQELNYKLYFISNEMGKSNCDWVKAIVSKLREGGVSRSYGIIDWDGKNKSSTEVMVHGEGQRYSIENFVYDPVYLAILFLEKLNGAHEIKSELAFDETYNQYNLAIETNEKLQNVWDWFINKIEEKFPNLKTSIVVKEIVYYNNKKVMAKEWYLTMQGHELEQKLRSTFTALSKFTSEGEFQNSLSIIMAKCFPLVPKDSIDLLKKLCL